MLPFHSKLHDYATAEQTIIIEGPLLFDYEFMFHIFERSLAIVRVNSFYTFFTLLRMYRILYPWERRKMIALTFIGNSIN